MPFSSTSLNSIDENNNDDNYNNNNDNNTPTTNNNNTHNNIPTTDELQKITGVLPPNIAAKILEIQKLLKSLQWPIAHYIKKRDESLIPYFRTVFPNHIIDDIQKLAFDVYEFMKHSHIMSPIALGPELESLTPPTSPILETTSIITSPLPSLQPSPHSISPSSSIHGLKLLNESNLHPPEGEIK